MKKITECWVWVIEDPYDDGNESTPAFLNPETMTWVPLFSTRERLLGMMEETAKKIVADPKAKGCAMRLLKFTNPEVVKEITA